MKGVLIWLKGNPITVAAGLVILLSLVFTAWVWSSFGSLRGDLETAAKEKGKLTNFTNNTVQLPASAIDAPPVEVQGVTYNPPTVERMKRIFSDLNSQTEVTIGTFAAFNQRGHVQLVENFFPAATGDNFNYKNRYRDAINTMLSGPGAAAGFAEANGVRLPGLKAGLPPAPEELQRRLARIVDEGLRAFGEMLTEEQAEGLQNEQKAALLEELTDRARSLDVYAFNDIGDTSKLPDAYPLPVMGYYYQGAPGAAWQLWESQLQTWILQDIVTAIGLANGVAVPGIPPLPGLEGGNAEGVLGASVKRLLSVEILPGYVGLHTTGGVGSLGDAAAGRAGGEGKPPPPVEGSVTPGEGIPTIQPNYFMSPTGRTSNPVFDVRHTRLLVHLDYKKLPVFLEALARTNFISVVDSRITTLDEYDFSNTGRLGGPFVYGVGEMVEAEFILESLWFRGWTTPLMPEVVRGYLGLDAPQATPDGAF